MRYMDESQKGYAELKKRHSGKDRNLRKRNQINLVLILIYKSLLPVTH